MNPMLQEIHGLPALLRDYLPLLDETARTTFDLGYCRRLRGLIPTGCGDSHHAALSGEMAACRLSGLSVRAMTAMRFARYTADRLDDEARGDVAVVGVSVSGEVARTVEALSLARLAGATTIALTASPGSRVAQQAERVLVASAPRLTGHRATPVPGVRSYAVNLLALFLMAIRIGEARGHLSASVAAQAREDLLGLADLAEATISACDAAARSLARAWHPETGFLALGSGANYGTALHWAAKLLEASGDFAVGQETEEWAHLQYFSRAASPTCIITAGQRDLSRAIEVAAAVKAIARPLAVVAPRAETGLYSQADFSFPLPDGVREMYSPLLAAIPGQLLAAHRAEWLGEPHFRGFGGGRSAVEGGGISRIRTSEILQTLPANPESG